MDAHFFIVAAVIIGGLTALVIEVVTSMKENE
jgi:hypothetical protein